MKEDRMEQNGSDSTNNSDKPKKKRKDRRVEQEYFELIEVKDPSTGEIIKQRVKITKYKTKGDRVKFKPVITEEDLGYELAADEDKI